MALKGVLQGRFLIEKRLGVGGMGEVYQATDQVSGWHVAVKRMLLDEDAPPEAFDPAQKFRGEFETLKTLDHPGIPRVLDFFLEDQCPCMVMEFIEGQNLDDWVQKVQGTGRNWIIHESDPMVDRQVLHFGLQLCVILEYIHARNLLHRDIKPSNIILRDRTERLVLVDFGLARSYSGSRSTKTQVGTLGYCSVEQAQGHPEPRSDLYSLAVTLNHLLTGNQPPPFEVKLLKDCRPDLPARLIATLDKACAFNAADRHASVSEFRRELEVCLQEQGGGAADHTVRPEYFMEASGTYTEEVEPAVPERISHYNWADQALLGGGPSSRPDARTLAPPAPPDDDEEEESSGVQRWVAAAKTRQVPRRQTRPAVQVHPFRVEEEDDLEFIRSLKSKPRPLYTHPAFVFLVLVVLTAMAMRFWDSRVEAARYALAARLPVGPAVALEGLRAGPAGSLDLVARENQPALVVYTPLSPLPGQVSLTLSVDKGSPDLMLFFGESREGRGAMLWLSLEPTELEYRACLTPATRFREPGPHPGMFFQLDAPADWQPVSSKQTFFVTLVRTGPGQLEARVGSLVLAAPASFETGCLGLYVLGEGEVNVRDLKVTR